MLCSWFIIRFVDMVVMFENIFAVSVSIHRIIYISVSIHRIIYIKCNVINISIVFSFLVDPVAHSV